MTAIDSGTAVRTATPRGRTLKVVQLQFVNRQTFIWVPLIILGASWILSMVIYWIIHTAGVDGVIIGGGAQAPLWYFLAVGISALTMSFPFSQAMSLTRREFFLGSLAAAAVSAAGMALVMTLLGLFERATDGYGMGAYFAYLSWLWEAGALGAGVVFFATIMLAFIIGFWFATIYKRFAAMGLTLVIFAIALVLLGLVALITWQQAWPDVWAWILDTGALGLALWSILLSVVLATGSYLTLRRMPA